MPPWHTSTGKNTISYIALILTQTILRGLEACVIDYVRPIIFGPAIPKITLGLLYVISAATLGGLLYYNHICIGIGRTGRRFWEIKC